MKLSELALALKPFILRWITGATSGGGGGGSAPANPAWLLAGNAGTTPGTDILGTTDGQNLEVHINGVRALLIAETGGTPNLVGGYVGNTAAGLVGAIIGGGGTAGLIQLITGNYGFIGGGLDNEAGGTGAVIAGGQGNETAANYDSIGGGEDNYCSGDFATIPGGYTNSATGDYAFAAGRRAGATNNGTFVWADSADEDYSSNNNDEVRFRCAGGHFILGRTATTTAVKPQLTLEAEVSTAATGGAAGFGVGQVFRAETATDGTNQDQAQLGTEWTDPANASRNALVRLDTYPGGSAIGHAGFWSGTAIDGTAQVIIRNAAGDVTKICTIQYAVTEIVGVGTAGGIATVIPGATVTLYTDGVDTLTVDCLANGELHIHRGIGADTFEAALWLVWR